MSIIRKIWYDRAHVEGCFVVSKHRLKIALLDVAVWHNSEY
ncbi:hypothetical protein U14_02573 [Candidatus Moduliflexus flocculans]|uniref:Uncharacterized protein n=1 Tax=Candidatus Moduliflexus flocculans TaxID=1499966 RepID=A0A081BLR4_9BACT|nr:hypothetical protein U14_02573 [Candidatus Moduliflexus flocculans]